MSRRVEDDRLDSPPAARLVEALGAELLERYGFPDPDPDQLTADDLAAPDGAFVLAWVDDTAVGCGGLRRYGPGVGELKRMFVTSAWRGHGIARTVLTALEDRAQRLGFERLVLETGVRQPEAIGLYRSAGYGEIEPYGFYRSAPHSRCYAKSLRPARGASRGQAGSNSTGSV